MMTRAGGYRGRRWNRDRGNVERARGADGGGGGVVVVVLENRRYEYLSAPANTRKYNIKASARQTVAPSPRPPAGKRANRTVIGAGVTSCFGRRRGRYTIGGDRFRSIGPRCGGGGEYSGNAAHDDAFFPYRRPRPRSPRLPGP